MTPKFHQLTIRHLERFGDFAVALGFAVPDELVESYRFLPGQYLTLRADID
ncbi:MAG: phenylacetic acid degradation protein, partial [SAR116 cluster bacterium]